MTEDITNAVTTEGNSESTPEALKVAAENIVQDIKEETPGIIDHLEAWGHIGIEEAEKIMEYLKTKFL